MREIQEIITNTGNISKEQVASDLSKEEKEELINLINVNEITPSETNDSIPFCTTPTPSPIPTCFPGNACSSESFCCVVVFSSELDVPTPKEIHAAVVPKNLFIEDDGLCNFKFDNCTIKLNKGKVNGSAEVFVSLGVKDKCGNLSFVCCKDFLCLREKDIICCTLPDQDKIKFIVNDLFAQKLNTCTPAPCDGDQQIWQITGTITFTCEECI